MDGKTHFIGGCLTGMGIAQYTNADLITAVSFTLLGGFVGLVPDLDVKGVLTKKISINKKWLIAVLSIIGLYLILSTSLSPHTYWQKWQGLLIGSALLVLPLLIITQKRMLILTGALVCLLSMYYESIWLMMLGIYIAVASFLPHRSLTHSLLGLAYFSWLGYFMEKEFLVDGMMFVCMGGYASHLLLDMKWLPKNRRGIKLFLPFSKVEI
ncbi:metal-dependent hydrolase [Lederbergia sp. NSJ-179]|uniref:metal-dependent hydrolase n=1 Tax=Lederbergia sp. NSJ-179 TaxID=2931402 RepID=UPI001FD3C801|nr:metal-dependent hydrolase [Lederbergia sp. NSJ-179]MCJ7843602.1 metal-dependent hydrolase [Lederbergia sp. NSJ-179]